MTSKIRVATPADAKAIALIYAPIVRDTVISFETEAPSADEMQARMAKTLERFPWLVSVDQKGDVDGYVYASEHRARSAYRWSVDTTAYVRSDRQRRGIGASLYRQLFEALRQLGYFQAFAGIALPNPASIALHESVGFLPIGVYHQVGLKLGAWHDVGWWQKSLQAPRPPAALVAFSDRPDNQ